MSRQYSNNYHLSSDNSYRPSSSNNYRPSSNNNYHPSSNNRTPYNNDYTPKYNNRDNRSSHHNTYNSRPNNNNNNFNSRPWKDSRGEQTDDCIAPKHTSQTTDCLQRWALATANFVQQGHHYKDIPIITRIQRRYASAETNPNAPFPRYSNMANDDDDEEKARDAKRRHSISPPPPGRSRSAVSVLRDSKRRKMGAAEGVVDLTGVDDEMVDTDHDYAESSEWSFPDSDTEITDIREMD